MTDAERLARVRAERVRDLYGRPATPVYAASVILVIMAVQAAAISWPTVRHQRALIWMALVLAVQALLIVLIRRFHRRPRTDAETQAWGVARAAAEALHGLVWAAIVPLLYPGSQPLALVPIIGTLVGLTAGVAAGLAVYGPALLGFTAGALLPACAALIWLRTGPDVLYIAAMPITTFVMVMANGARMSLLYREAIELRLDMAAQVETLQQLQEAAEAGRRIAEDAAAERLRFFSAASHDLRQPVHALGLYVSLLRRDPPARERRELIGSIAACADSLERLFNAILGVAQAAQGRDAERIAPMPLQPVLERVLLQLRPEAESRGLSLRLRPTSAWAQTNPAVIERILANLVGNAIRYTDGGGVLVGVRRRAGGLDLMVADTGVGLGEADRQRVFDAFFRLRSARAAPGRPGFGLGLATVRQLCLTYGYAIDLASTPGRGTVFRVSVPRAEPAPDRAEAPAPSMPARLNVLVVEDDPLVADAVGKLLQAWDVAAHLCADSAGAVRILDAAEGGGGRWFAIVDYRLAAEETGLDVLDRIRAHPAGAMPAALLTGELDPAVFEGARARQVAVLHKPLRPIRLRALLASAGAEAVV